VYLSFTSMKKYLLFLAMTACCNAAFAQLKTGPIATIRAERWQLPVGYEQQSAAKNTAAKDSRLIKRAAGRYLSGSFPYEDSAYNIYSPTRGYHEKLGWMFDTSSSYIQSPGQHTSARPGTRTVHTFNTAGVITRLDVYSWDGSTSSWPHVARIEFGYINGKVSETVQSSVVSGALELIAKTEFYDNPLAKTYTTVRQEWDKTAGQWTYKEREITYNTTNKPDSIVFETRNGVSWEAQKKTYYTYAGGNAVLIGRTIKSGGNWVHDYRESNTYNNGKVSMTTLETYNQTTSAWENTSKEEYTYDNNGNLTETIRYAYLSGNYVNDSKEKNTYNNYNQVLTSTSQQWNGNMWLYTEGQDMQLRYYYEEYTTNVKDIAKASQQLKVYPVPAEKMIFVELPQQSALPYTVLVTDMQGKIIIAKESVTGTVTLDLAQAPAGNYMIKAENGTGSFIGKATIVR
jgi:Secretion system C-terminal sorting domain